ncbi:flagellar capping protein [Clostridium tepidiprofundi DSM 19306]|uniref:Flagellar hook-associated protein 2 n=1 Tax=Clostridium tepidiprofundi DSM 19306 TaxID=1121338 RepID=A0A151B4F8_9CLOT|nr:flagellar filament capping protein FliD [Clostridium tepidiprofundi]KYH34804.1 flagellar capping protein [Clostridium tepidiprofundi DSM 19306]
MSDISGVSSSNMLRITGLATGLDTDDMVKKMVMPYKVKVNAIKQDKQIIEWKQEAYRDIINDLKSFNDKYFDVLSDNYILSPNKFAGFDVTTSNSSIANATALAGAKEGDYTVDVAQLAKKAQVDGVSLRINGNESLGFTDTNWKNNVIEFDIGGTTSQINLKNTDMTVEQRVNDINDKIAQNSSLNGKVYAVVSNGKIKFNTVTTNTVKITSNSTVASDLDNLKNKVLNPTAATKLSDLNTSISGTVSMQISYGGTTKTITIDDAENKTINDVIQQINSDTDGNVIASFSELTGKFTLETSNYGSAASVKIDNIDASLSSAIGLSSMASANYGQDAVVKITPPGATSATEVTRANNNFIIDNVKYDIKDIGTTSITVSSNVDDVYDKVKGFIDKYNKIIGKISKKLEEKKSYSYKPLTDEQKKDMSKDDIKKWEDKAKEGILKNDNVLENMLTSLRRAFFDSVEGAGINFSKKEIGLDTSSDVIERGKIIISDETKFKEVLKNKGQQILNLFVKKSDSQPTYSRTLSSSERSERYSEEGIFQRINDIIQDNISTFRDNNGNKGALLQKAGIKDDTSFINNLLTKQIEEKNKLIKELNKKMADKENYYYKMFSKLEVAMNRMNAQSDWLAQQLGGGM